jgi:exopolysaccharide production protein ExoQ
MNARRILIRSIDIIIILAAFLFTNSTAFSITPVLPVLTDFNKYPWAIVKACLIIVVVVFVQLKLLSLWPAYLSLWKKQIILIIFAIYSLCSLAWTVFLKASLYELALFLYASVVGVYLVVRYDKHEGLKIIQGIGVFCVIASFALLFTFPPLARLDNIYEGAWRGIFWHRNHMGSLMAFFSSVFLLMVFLSLPQKNISQKKQFFNNVLCFILAAILVFGSRSATGIILFFVLNVFVILAYLWLSIRQRLTNRHYLAFAIFIGVSAIILLLNMNFIFGLLGRDSTLTGRTKIWTDLISRVWVVHPIFGYGFGALWNQEAFRIAMQTRHGWSFQVFFSDNGYLDFLLNLGVTGLLIFLMFFVKTGIQVVKNFFEKATLPSLFPLLIFIYVLVANISYSFFLEVDQFVWMLLIMAAFWSIAETGA